MSGNAGCALSLLSILVPGRPIAALRGRGRQGFFGATGAVSIVATNGATFYLTGVKLEIGSVATPFNRQSLAKSMADCQRYYQFAQLLADCSARWGAANARTITTLPVFCGLRRLR